MEGVGEMLESLGEEWANAPLYYQRDMPRTIFEAVCVDVLGRRLVCVRPDPPFVPLFRMDGLEEREDGCFYCEEDQETRSKGCEAAATDIGGETSASRVFPLPPGEIRYVSGVLRLAFEPTCP